MLSISTRIGIREIGISYLIVLIVGAVYVFTVPYLVIDETRYLTVAWEMHLNHSFLVPTLNNEFYSHKPPLFFWLINLNWFMLGINEKTLRFIPLLFSLFNLLMTYRIGLKLWGDVRTAAFSTLILSSMFVYLLWSPLIMFDILLTFWVLLGVYGFLVGAEDKKQRVSWLLVGLSIAGGLLTKGPVILVHVLPLGIMYFIWVSKEKALGWRWYLGLGLAVLIGVGTAMIWVVPATIAGGEEYEKAILWSQTADRMVSSMAHQRPIWWYIPMLPVLIFPWILVGHPWIVKSDIKLKWNYRFLAVWIGFSIGLFSLISGKQLYYLVPTLPAFSLLIGRGISRLPRELRGFWTFHRRIGAIYVGLGCTLSVLAGSVWIQEKMIPSSLVATLGIGLIVLGSVLFIFRSKTVDGSIRGIAIFSVIVFIVFLVAVHPLFASRYDVRNVARILKEKQEAGYAIVNSLKYFGQFHFLGRLEKPLVVITDIESIGKYINNNEKVLIISYEERDKNFDQINVLYNQLYRGGRLIIWNEKGVQDFIEGRLR
ncbi:MAG: Undecaprenyl phosphate-alpha-4-amino-4-deoxy-L-arabinose arabinosyl transferase [Candidatus Moanabacter tarae]|uniref:Undecaprenyl phosphate-alpha-4-amino-4-deoxy-L-arabinose arabinosyl transferase n=1 Tax=Candidatus Moanibacter tarae TaxID=2200854 RepID=A0A2Z4AEE5_9BACT|nr:MAG: Undecaprenyl phosphate-alpha-4-amino-4-deoxy-L-arabinose arabinosyl transferase [Candidatus Moanabacter tarae]